MAGYTSPYRKNISDVSGVLSLNAKNEQGKRANWTVRVSGNKVRLTIWTGVEGDADKGKIALVLEPEQWYCFLALLEHTINTNTGEPFANIIEIKGLGQGGYREGPKHRGDICIGRSKENVIFFAVVVQNRPIIKFELIDGYWFVYRKKDGSEFSKTDATNMVANAYLTRAREIVSTLLVTEFVEKDNKNNTGSGSYSSNSNSNISSDDDLDF